MELKVGSKYNWKYTPETKLVYLGKKGSWHQFAKIEHPEGVWCEVLDEDLHLLEETNGGVKIRTPQDFVETLIRRGWEVKHLNGAFEWHSPRGVEYNSAELYRITLAIFNDANKHGELS